MLTHKYMDANKNMRQKTLQSVKNKKSSRSIYW